uniref:Tetraspanin 34b n=1 Tax=Gasterosteus aculeatus aculeatus TaxID=481459 RepID=G3NTC5_GASAC
TVLLPCAACLHGDGWRLPLSCFGHAHLLSRCLRYLKYEPTAVESRKRRPGGDEPHVAQRLRRATSCEVKQPSSPQRGERPPPTHHHHHHPPPPTGEPASRRVRAHLPWKGRTLRSQNGLLWIPQNDDVLIQRHYISTRLLLLLLPIALPQLAGAAVLGVGIWVKVDSGSILAFLGKIENAPAGLSHVLNVGYLLIAVGALLLVIGFLGCCGAVRESSCMLLLFFIIVMVVFIAEVAGAVVILVFRPLAEELLTKFGEVAAKNIHKDYGNNSDVTGLWNATMSSLHCCGFYNSSDFVGSPYYNQHHHQYPPQCCLPTVQLCNQTIVDSDPMVTGCFAKIKKLIEDNMAAIVGVALGIAALEICAMGVSMILYCRIKSRGD